MAAQEGAAANKSVIKEIGRPPVILMAVLSGAFFPSDYGRHRHPQLKHLYIGETLSQIFPADELGFAPFEFELLVLTPRTTPRILLNTSNPMPRRGR